MHKHTDASISLWYAVAIAIIGALAIGYTFAPVIATVVRYVTNGM